MEVDKSITPPDNHLNNSFRPVIDCMQLFSFLLAALAGTLSSLMSILLQFTIFSESQFCTYLSHVDENHKSFNLISVDNLAYMQWAILEQV